MAKPPPKPPRELSLEEAMSSLGVSEKTIRKYIKLKRLKAVKVGKRWFIDEASLELMRRIVQDEPLVTTAKSSTVKARHVAPTSANAMAVHGLACYRLFLAASSQFHFDQEEAEIAAYFRLQSRDTLALLGAGYYGYGRSKTIAYEQARAAIGKILGILASDPEMYRRHQVVAELLEKDVLPAFGALMRKLETKGTQTQHRREVSDPHRGSGGSALETDRVP